ncbi:MAG: DUF4126 domain-containing protein [Anaerolineae bacterium]|nr:DUF4126 domain-containing protein [Anaerolineae bacterium]
MDVLANLATAFGLSASAGLNAYVPLFIVAVVARYTDWIKLGEPYNVLTNGWVIAALGVLLAIEFFADKIPLVDHMNDVVGTVVRPAAGAVLFAATTGAVRDMNPAVAVIAGLIVAGSVHATKAAVRPVVTASTMGLGNPVVSTIEDVTAATVSLGAIFLPLVFAVLVALAFVGVWWLVQRWRRRWSARSVYRTTLK